MAGFGRRLAALMIDWLICTWAIAQGLLGMSSVDAAWVGLLVFAVENVLLVGTIGMTFGMRLMNIRVATLDRGRPRWVPTIARTVLLCLAVPAVMLDRDRRGIHDRVSATVVVRT